MKRILLTICLVLLVAGLSGCRCIAQGVNGLGQDFQAWTQPYVNEQTTKHRELVAQQP